MTSCNARQFFLSFNTGKDMSRIQKFSKYDASRFIYFETEIFRIKWYIFQQGILI